jgi:UPF0271 protein
MLQVVTSANVACGFHAGDPVGLLRVCRTAAERGVRIGAQVSYRDLAGFGRRFIDVSTEDLVADVVYQIGALQGIAAAAGSTVSYVKPHGALYNTIVTNREQAAAVATAVHLVDATLPVLGMAGSAFFGEAARLGLRTVTEAFADRAYRRDGQLVSRREPGAVLHDPAEIAQRVMTMVTVARSRSVWNLFACMVIRRVRCRSRPRCATSSRPPAAISGRFADAAQARSPRYRAVFGSVRGTRRQT